MDKTAWFVVLACIAGLGINYWVQYDASQQAAAAPQQPAAVAPATVPSTAPVAQQPTTVAPQQPATTPVAPAATTRPQVIATLTGKDKDGKDVARFNFCNVGGSISSVTMLGKAINSTIPELQSDVEINGNAAQGIGTLMFGLSANQAPRFDQTVYQVIPAETDDTKVTLFGTTGNLLIRKVYSLLPLQRGENTIDGNAYALNLSITIQNASGQTLAGNNWGLYTGAVAPISEREWATYVSYITMVDGDFNKEGVDTFNHRFTKNETRRLDGRQDNLEWGGLMNQYYATVVKPDKASATSTIYAAPTKLALPVTGEQKPGVELGLGIPDFTLTPAGEGMQAGMKELRYDIFAGPKLNLMLNGMTDEFRKIDRVMDYGIFTILSHPMNWLLNAFHSWFGNWGWAIVAMTFVVRLLIWPLYRKSYKSMKSMSLLQPKMQELKEKYPNDQQKVSIEMMKLYREYGISPAGGCLPMLLQMPIFFAFFYVLQTAEEFRGAPFIGWVTDLSQMDTICTLPIPFLDWNLPINILPVTMVLLMWLQMRMTPQGGDPMQRRIIQLMPLFFFAFCYFYQSALALYWTVTNIISIFQTWLIRRLPEPELKKVDTSKKKPGKKSFMERMMEAQQQALAEQQRQQNMRNVTPKK